MKPDLSGIKPVAEVKSMWGDPEAFGERKLKIDPSVLQRLSYGAKLYDQSALEAAHEAGRRAGLEEAKTISSVLMTDFGKGFEKLNNPEFQNLWSAAYGAAQNITERINKLLEQKP